MSSLLSNLSMAGQALNAQTTGLDVVGQNIANANTAGYTRRRLELAAVPSTDGTDAGGGVEVTGISSLRDPLLDVQYRNETTAEGKQAAMADGLSVLETAIGKTGTSIDGALADLFDAFSTLADEPTSSTARQTVLVEGEALADSFRSMAEELVTARKNADIGVAETVQAVNDLAEKIAKLNVVIAQAGSDSASLTQQDELNVAIDELSQYLDVTVISREDGGADISLASGQALVVGRNTYALTTGSNAEGMTTIVSGTTDVTAQITSGKLGGLIELRDTLIPGYMDQLDQLAYSVATEINAVHEGGLDLNGDGGLAFFTTLTSADGAAAAIEINSALAGNPDLVAAGGTLGTDNENARALAALSSARVMNGDSATFSDAWANLVYTVGRDSASAQEQQESLDSTLQQIDSLRDQVSGVSLDEEATDLITFQSAYEANAQYFTVIDNLLDTLIAMVG